MRRNLAGVLMLACALPWAGCSTDEGEGRQEGATIDESPPAGVVELDSAALEAARLEIVAVEPLASRSLAATGNLTYDADALARLGPKIEGRIVRLAAGLGQRVAAGSVLAVLESPDLGALQGELERARAAVEPARRNAQREARLFEQKVSSEKEMLEARAAYEEAQADLEATRTRLRILGASEGGGSTFQILSPLAGTVLERDAVLGEIASPEDVLFTIADLSRLWLMIDVYEKDLAKTSSGQRVAVRVPAYPDQIFEGRIAVLGQVVDRESHTVKTRVVVENPDGHLLPGMFARSEIVLPEAPGTLAVPNRAIQRLDDGPVVFVPEGGGLFRPQPVEIGPQAGDGLVVVSGLSPGQKVVGEGSFFLKSELLKASFGDDD